MVYTLIYLVIHGQKLPFVQAPSCGPFETCDLLRRTRNLGGILAHSAMSQGSKRFLPQQRYDTW